MLIIIIVVIIITVIIIIKLFQGMIALRREATEVIHEDYIDGKICIYYIAHYIIDFLCRCDGSASKEEEKLNLLCMKQK